MGGTFLKRKIIFTLNYRYERDQNTTNAAFWLIINSPNRRMTLNFRVGIWERKKKEVGVGGNLWGKSNVTLVS